MASIRLRGHLLMHALRRIGLRAEWFSGRRAEEYDTVVLGKRYDEATFETVVGMQAKGTRVILDLCDNHFHYSKPSPFWKDRAERLRGMVGRVDHVVVSTFTLAEVVEHECGRVTGITVIGDPEDDLTIVRNPMGEQVSARLAAREVRRRLRALRESGHTALVWFGNYGVDYAEAGMLDLLSIRAALEGLHRSHPVSLTVISNSRKLYKQAIEPWSLPTLYGDWHPITFRALMREHDVAVIPIVDNPFTRCKTENRVVEALACGLAIVADEIPSYRPYAEVLRLGCWEEELLRVVGDPSYRSSQQSAAFEIARSSTSIQSIASAWRGVLQQPGRSQPSA